MSLAFADPMSVEAQLSGRDAFLEALNNPTFHVRILDREPKTLEEAFKLASRLETYDKVANKQFDEPAGGGVEMTNRRGKYFRAASKPIPTDGEDMAAQLDELRVSLRECKTTIARQAEELKQLKSSAKPPVSGPGNQTGSGRNWQASGRRRETRRCYDCDEVGHISKYCPSKKTIPPAVAGQSKSVKPDEQTAADKSTGKIQVLIRSSPDAAVYLRVRCPEGILYALLDTGCETSVIESSLVKPENITKGAVPLCSKWHENTHTWGDPLQIPSRSWSI